MRSSRLQRLILGAGAGALAILLSSGFEAGPTEAKAPGTQHAEAQIQMHTAMPSPLAGPVGVQSFMDKMAAQR